MYRPPTCYQIEEQLVQPAPLLPGQIPSPHTDRATLKLRLLARQVIQTTPEKYLGRDRYPHSTRVAGRSLHEKGPPFSGLSILRTTSPKNLCYLPPDLIQRNNFNTSRIFQIETKYSAIRAVGNYQPLINTDRIERIRCNKEGQPNQIIRRQTRK